MSTKDSSVSDVIRILFNFGYRKIRPLARGGFGTVLSAVSPDQQKVAVKVIKRVKCWEVEEKIWPTLRHEHLLPLIEKIDIKYLDLKLFVMPFHPNVLHRVLASKSFKADKTGLYRVKRWLLDILEGMEYLHSLGFAHLDIKNDNVLIASDDRALLCDYSGLNFTKVPLERLCAPKVFRPPECFDELLCKNVEGSACDVWLFGLMSLNILTGNWPSLNMGKVTDDASWKTNVETVLIDVLKVNNFCRHMKKSFPSIAIPAEELLLAHHFVASILQWDQNERPSVQHIKCHPFLTCFEFGDSFYISEPEEVKTVLTSHFAESWNDPNIALRLSCEKETEINENVLNVDSREPLNDEVHEKINAPAVNKSNQVLNHNLEKPENSETECPKQKKNLGTRILHWVTKKYSRIFKKKK